MLLRYQTRGRFGMTQETPQSAKCSSLWASMPSLVEALQVDNLIGPDRRQAARILMKLFAIAGVSISRANKYFRIAYSLFKAQARLASFLLKIIV